MADYPKHFYRARDKIVLRHTKTPTGHLRNPIDLVYKEAPWLTIDKAIIEEKTEEKTLVYVFPFYSKNLFKRSVYNYLTTAKNNGFKKIIIFNQRGEPEEWDGTLAQLTNFPADYEKLTNEFIQQRIWQQFKIPAKDLLILDYFELREELATSFNEVMYLTLDDFTAPELRYLLSRVKDFPLHVSLITKPNQEKLDVLGAYVKNYFSIEEKDVLIDAQRLKVFLTFFPNLKTLRYARCTYGDFGKLPPDTGKIEELAYWGRWDVAFPYSLLSVLRHLRKVEITHTRFSDQKVAPLLPNINSLKLAYVIVEISDLQALIVSPLLTRLELIEVRNRNTKAEEYIYHNPILRELKPYQLKQLKQLSLGTSSLHLSDIRRLLAATPHLESLEVSTADNYGCFEHLSKNHLAQLNTAKLVPFKNYRLSVKDIERLLLAAPNLRYLSYFPTKETSIVFENLAKNSLPELETFDFLGSTELTVRAIRKLLDAAPNLCVINNCDLIDFNRLGKELPLPYYQRLCKIANLKIHNWDQELCIIQQQLSQPTNAMSSPANPITPPFTEKYWDIKDEKNTLPYFEYFPKYDASLYRLHVWQPNLDDKYQQTPFLPDDFEPVDIEKKVGAHLQPGLRPVSKGNGTTVILPSLDPEEKLFNLKIIDSTGKQVDLSKVKLQYSKKTNFYSVVLPEEMDCTIYFDVELPDFTKKQELPRELRRLEEKYNAYGISKKSLDKSFESLRALAKHIQTIEKGACRHRVLAAYEELKEKYGNNVRIRFNDLHAQLEIKHNHHWYTLDLGGYPGLTQKKQLSLHQEKKIEEKISQEEKPATTATQTISPSNFQVKSLNLKALLTKAKRPGLVTIANDNGLQIFYESLKKLYPTENIFVAHQPESINTTSAGMTEAGEIKPNYSDFNRWLMQQTDKPAVICLDVRMWKSGEIAQLNDFLEHKLDGKPLPSNFRIIVIDDAKRTEYGPDFRRRVPIKTEIITQKIAPLEPVPEEKIPHPRIEIDLFESANWQQIVFGNWKLTPTKDSTRFAFSWEKSLCLEAMLQGKPIVFKNPPLDDPSFTRFIAEIKSLKRISYADKISTLLDSITFHQSQGYDWATLGKNSKLIAQPNHLNNPPFVLSDTTLSDFIKEPRCAFSPKTQRLEIAPSHFLAAKQKSRYFNLPFISETAEINVVAAPGLSAGALAQFMSAAEKQGITVNFLTPNGVLSQQSELKKLFPQAPLLTEEKIEGFDFKKTTHFYLTPDPYCFAQALVALNPEARCYDISSLEGNELGRFPLHLEKMRQDLMATGTLCMTAPLADLIQKLKQGETIILYGSISPSLYDALHNLSFGFFEGEPLKGKLFVITSPDYKDVVQTIQGATPIADDFSMAAKMSLLQAKYKNAADIQLENKPFSLMERDLLQARFDAVKISTLPDEKAESDEELADLFDQNRLTNIKSALAISPWVMIKGPTGIGKSHFIEQVLSRAYQTTSSLTVWLTKIEANEPCLLIWDEANFSSQLSNLGENFLARFKALKNKPPTFYWQGKEYILAPHHLAIFAFNQEQYGAGREHNEFLEDHSMSVPFKILPDFYVRARIINPLLKQLLPAEWHAQFADITRPIIKAYKWITDNHPNEILITPREIKAIITWLASEAQHLKSKESIIDLATEITFLIAKQTLADYPHLLARFSAEPPRPVLARHLPPVSAKDETLYFPYQTEAYGYVSRLLAAREFMQQKTLKNKFTDMGLGGIILEGGAGIGKSKFIAKILAERPNEKIIYIPANLSLSEKEIRLKDAFASGAIAVAEEMNTSLWPNKLLNNLFMGKDENGKPAETPGFLLIATNNPPSFQDREEEDPAIRRRVIKLKLDWPVLQVPPAADLAPGRLGMFAGSQQQAIAPPRQVRPAP